MKPSRIPYFIAEGGLTDAAVLFQSSDEWNRSNCDATLGQYGSGAQRVLHPTSPGGVQQPVRPIISPGDLRPAGGDKVLPLFFRVNGLTVINRCYLRGVSALTKTAAARAGTCGTAN
jgi:hypothetical protein